ncbi:hypothetical protein OAM64_04330 [Candidatus Thioglobus sp.]|nr:hypothetical protein [Candidatus Thioglobus sp.]
MNHDIMLEYYFLALNDIRNGSSIQELEEALKIYESSDEFEACAGILKAINEVKYTTIKNLKNGHKND